MDYDVLVGCGTSVSVFPSLIVVIRDSERKLIEYRNTEGSPLLSLFSPQKK